MSESPKASPRRSVTATRALSVILLSAGAALCCTVPTAAQNFGATFFDDDILPPRVIAWRLADRGFTNVSRPRFDGRVYVVDAVGPAGLPVRLILDPASGAIIDRQRPVGAETYARLERPPVRSMPGYGWTEDDVAGARPAPQPLPPESIPGARSSRPLPREAARPADPNPLGLNPDGNRRAEPPRKVARTAPAAQPEKPSLSRVSPLAPTPKAAPEAARPESPPPPAAARTEPAPEAAPPAKETAAPAEKPVAQAASKPEWRDPPEGKRPVRVIGGATIVPGTGDKAGEAAQSSQ